MKNKLIKIAAEYNKVISAFMKRGEVQNGKLVSYHDNQDPFGNLRQENWFNLGDAKVTTGFCVSFSQAILTNEIFKTFLEYRGAIAKLVSIDIKEQYYGFCKPSYQQNMWHTAILVKDDGLLFIIDPTCSQFGNSFVGKLIWDLETWERTFRSPKDTHSVIGFGEENISYLPKLKDENNYQQKLIDVINSLHSVTTIDNNERELIGDFLIKGINLMNRKIQVGNMTDGDFNYIDIVNNLLKNLNFKIGNEDEYFVMRFETKDSALRWIKRLANNDYILPIYMLTSNDLNKACENANIYSSELNNDATDNETFIVIKISNVSGIDLENILPNVSSLIPYGIQMQLIDDAIINGGKLLPETSYGIEKKTNTIYINCTI